MTVLARIANLDGMRFWAALSLVWVHTVESAALGDSTALGRFAVPFFTGTAVLLASGSISRRPGPSLWNYTAARFRRIYVVFLVWAGVYLLIQTAASAVVPYVSRPNLAPVVLWTGTVHHLWFLPFIFAASVASAAIARPAECSPHAKRFLALILAAAGLAIGMTDRQPVADSLGGAAALVFDTLPAFCWGLALALSPSEAHRRRLCGPATLGLGLSLLTGGTAWVWLLGRNNLAENLAGLGAVFVAFHPRPLFGLAHLASWGRCALGLYAVHVLYIEGLQDVLRLLGYEDRPAVDGAVFVTATAASLTTVRILQRWRWTRPLVQ